MIRSAALVFAVLALDAAAAAPKKLTLLFTGDNGAQVAPCG